MSIVPMEARREHCIPWSWSCRDCELPAMGTGNQEKCVLLTTELSLQF